MFKSRGPPVCKKNFNCIKHYFFHLSLTRYITLKQVTSSNGLSPGFKILASFPSSPTALTPAEFVCLA